MGTSHSAGELASKLMRAGSLVDDASRAGTRAAGLAVKVSVVAELGGVTRLRGVGKSGARIGVRYDQRNKDVEVRMTGPAHLIERDTKPHPIGPRKKKALTLAGGQVRSFVGDHPGTKGKHPFEKGVNRVLPRLTAIVLAEQVKSMRRIFD